MSEQETPETPREMLDRLFLISTGERECDLSDNDAAALEWLLVSRRELLEALKAVIGLGYCDNIGFAASQDYVSKKAILAVRRAIAKAEGRS